MYVYTTAVNPAQIYTFIHVYAKNELWFIVVRSRIVFLRLRIVYVAQPLWAHGNVVLLRLECDTSRAQTLGSSFCIFHDLIWKNIYLHPKDIRWSLYHHHWKSNLLSVFFHERQFSISKMTRLFNIETNHDNNYFCIFNFI